MKLLIDQVTPLGLKEKNTKQNPVKWAQLSLEEAHVCMHTNIQTTKLFSMIGGGCGSNIDSKPFICKTQIGKETHSKSHSMLMIECWFLLPLISPTISLDSCALSPSHSQPHWLLVREVGVWNVS